MIEEPGYLFYRVRGDFHKNADLRNYPLDKQTIEIKIEDGVLTTEDMVYVLDEEASGIDDEVEILGWDLVGEENRVTNGQQTAGTRFSSFFLMNR